MRRKVVPITPALSLSLLLHGLTLFAMAWYFVKYTAPPKTPPLDRWKILTNLMIVPPPAANRVPSKPKTAPKAKPRQLLPKFEKSSPPPKDDSGEAQGKGTANRTTPGSVAMQAHQGYEQADLTRDKPDEPQIDPSALLPAAGGDETGSNSSLETTSRPGEYTPDFVTESSPQQSQTSAPPRTPATPGVGMLPKPFQAKTEAEIATGAAKPASDGKSVQSEEAKRPKRMSGHRAVASDAESVAFSKAPSIELHDGKVEARAGLKVTPRIPRFGLASEQDLGQLGRLHVVIGAWVDLSGKVIDTTVLESSGSEYVDQDCRLAVFEWKFEPPKDKNGQPTATQWSININ